MVEVKTKQPEVNIGLVGHVDHGKTSLLQAISGKWADTHSEELKKGITIKLGYADVNLYENKGKISTSEGKYLRTISFIDAPGHETLMATMLSGAAIMDGALLMISVNEECPQPQTKEHLMALDLIGIRSIIIIQNKVDLVSKEKALENYKKIKEFVMGTVAENAPIIPISAQHKVNIDLVLEAIEKNIPTPKRNEKQELMMLIARSFDINKPGTKINNLVGGVVGGTIKQGVLKLNEKVIICPGRKILEKNVNVWVPIETEIVTIKTGGQIVQSVGPGGSIAVLTKLDPAIVKSDQLTGNIVCLPDKQPPIIYDLVFASLLLKEVVGVKKNTNVEPIKLGEPLMLNVNSATTAGIVNKVEKDKVFVKLKVPVCAEYGSKIAISRHMGGRWRLIGTGIILKE